MSQESKTPRADAELFPERFEVGDSLRFEVVPADFARQLERELAAVTEERDAFIASARIKEANSGWRPIETAPKDGSRIMVANTHGAWFAEWLEKYTSGLPARYWFSTMLNHCHIAAEFRYEKPTHWMPLPAPPTTEPEQ